MEQFSAQGFGHQAEKPTQILSDEHRIIERVLDAVQRLALAPARQNVEHWQKALEFIRGFADQCHHCKEEQVLFPALEAHGIPTEGGPVGMMLLEHEEGRSLVRAMMDASGAHRGGRRQRRSRAVRQRRAVSAGCCASIFKKKMKFSFAWPMK